MNRIIKIILHLFYWLVFCCFSGAVSYRLTGGFDFIAKNILSFGYNLAWAAIQFYAFYFFFYRFIEKQRYFLYFTLSVLVSVGLSLVLTLLYQFVFDIRLNYHWMEFVPQMVGTFIIAQTGSLLKGFIRWFEDIQRKQVMEKMVLQNELDALNAQLNPHFLFNTLNNIDSLIRSNPEKASESLVTLSEIMRYMLYDARKPIVLLQNEITHYRNIIKLQSLRLKHSERIIFDVDIQNENVEIAPLLLLPFIENTFKFASFEGEGTAIEITLKSIENRVEFSCRNQFQSDDPTLKSKTGGIGLSNLKRRLDLLYKGRYKLTVTDENSCFVAQLTIVI
jgi:two-component system, LytTR family, sensor kinase